MENTENTENTTAMHPLGAASEPTFGTFGWALWQIGNGRHAARSGWNGAGQWIALQVPDENSKMRKPYVYMSAVDGELVPWLASQTDMLATDWQCA